MTITFTLLIASLVILLCVVFNKISSRLGVPMLLAFIVLGMLFGSDGILKIPFENYAFAEQICSVALIFIMFYGGFGTNWKAARPVAGKSMLLSSLGVVLTAGLTGLFCHFVLRIELLESLLIGSVISSTDAASVFSILRSKKLNLKDNTASMLELESGSNDPFSYMLTVLVLSFMGGGIGAGRVIYMVFAQVAYGAAIGVALAFAALFVLRHFRFATDGFDTIFVVAVAVLAYVLPTLVGGNGYLATYIVGIIMGNSRIQNKRPLVHFFDGITGLMQMLIFFLLGLLAFPSQLPAIFLPAAAIALFLTFVARPAAVFAILTPAKCSWRQQLLVSWTGLRGAASIVFAIMATIDEAYTRSDVFHMVFCIVLLSIAFQGTLIPWVARRLHMVDDSLNVQRTFNDYVEEEEVQFIKLSISASHPWKDRPLRELTLLPDTLVVLLIRDKKPIVPRGGTVFREGDVAVISAPAFHDDTAVSLIECHIESDSEWNGKPVSAYAAKEQQFIILIKRGAKCIIPNGKTVIHEKDVLVISGADHILAEAERT